VLRDVDGSLTAWLRDLVPGVRVSCEPPASRPASDGSSGKGRTAASLYLYLHAVREDAGGSTVGWSDLRNGDGVVVGRLPPSRRYRLNYLLLPDARDAAAEHELLGRVLAGTALSEALPAEFLVGALGDAHGGPGTTVLVRCAPATSAVDTTHLWAAWGLSPRATLELSVLAPLPLSYVEEVAAAPSTVQLGAARRPRPTADESPAPARPRPAARIQED
jgi:hypothetical protein